MIKLITLITKFIIAALVSLLFSSCDKTIKLAERIKGNGTITTETRALSQDFKNIEVSDGIRVKVQQSNNKSITIEADENLQDHIITKIENGVLKIETYENYSATETPVVTVKMPIINGLETNSGSEINSSGTLITENIKVKSSSGSQIDISVEADVIKLECNSGSSIEVSGKALNSEIYTSSGSKIDAKNLMTNAVMAKSESASSISVHPILNLDAKAFSGSSINYHKVPRKLVILKDSGGSVNQK